MIRFLCLLAMTAALAAETLYNGIRLPADWPPHLAPLTVEPPETPPYLVSPPDVIPIDAGRQLFVDHFLIEETTLRRTFHAAEYYLGNPVLKPDQPWELEGTAGWAMPFSDGVWWDPADRLLKMWYMGHNATLYAASKDGVRWEKPALDVRPGTNTVHIGRRDSATVWLDLEEKDARRRYKFLYSAGHLKPLYLHFSADGVHWGDAVAESVSCDDRTTFFWNPFRKVWVFSLRDTDQQTVGRFRRYWEHADVVEGTRLWKRGQPTPWVGADRLDPRRVDLNVQPQLYNLDAVAYESIVLGLFSIWRGQPTDRGKPNEVVLGFSRDGFHWDRPSRRAFIPVSERHGDWNWSNVQSAGGGCLVVGDRLYFYVSGRAGLAGFRDSGITSTGLATLRRDGFASMDAGALEGSLTTRPLPFSGKHLFVNADAASGALLRQAPVRECRRRLRRAARGGSRPDRKGGRPLHSAPHRQHAPRGEVEGCGRPGRIRR
ncbi:MAG: hypothetical protein HY238_04045 [Acidobacteria bacterium]|nr:hypothetical protein [Acidobacteriota bacterium]